MGSSSTLLLWKMILHILLPLISEVCGVGWGVGWVQDAEYGGTE